jgi:hypothetical protein
VPGWPGPRVASCARERLPGLVLTLILIHVAEIRLFGTVR